MSRRSKWATKFQLPQNSLKAGERYVAPLIMNAFLSKVQSKFQEARISNVNHELGKVKENLVSESSAYLSNLRNDAALVGSLIRSESAKISKLLSAAPPVPEERSGLPKSTSLPAISAKSRSKYQYKSTLHPPAEEEDLGDQEEPVSDQFIRVVEYQESHDQETVVASRQCNNTREAIRQKLAFGSEDITKPATASNTVENKDLEICFINEAVSEEDDEDTRVKTELKEDSSEDQADDFEYDSDTVFPRSKSDWEAFRNPGSRLLHTFEATGESYKAKSFRKKLLQLQKEVQLNLQDCQQIAKSHIAKEKKRQRNESALKKLVGSYPDELSPQKLLEFNITKLQVIVNHFHSEIERLNEDLVKLLLEKDELQIEQDSQLLDVEDLCHSLKHEDLYPAL